MKTILKQLIEWKKIELLINTKIFNQDLVLEAAYWFLDKWYFFFDLDADENLILQFTLRDWVSESLEDIIADFSDEILNMHLRDKIERDNKVIRETIVTKAINGPLDLQNFVTLDTDVTSKKSEEDFDKDLNEILNFIGNEPSLNIDDEQVENILKEIDESSKNLK